MRLRLKATYPADGGPPSMEPYATSGRNAVRAVIAQFVLATMERASHDYAARSAALVSHHPSGRRSTRSAGGRVAQLAEAGRPTGAGIGTGHRRPAHLRNRGAREADAAGTDGRRRTA